MRANAASVRLTPRQISKLILRLGLTVLLFMWILRKIDMDSVQAAGTVVHIESTSGENILTFLPTKEYQSVLVSSPELQNGESYLVFTGGSATGTPLDGLYTDGTYTPLLEEDDDIGFGTATVVPADKIIGTTAGAAISGAQANGDVLPSIGVFSNKRYLRLSFVSTGTTTGATIAAIYQGGTEVSPDSKLSA